MTSFKLTTGSPKQGVDPEPVLLARKLRALDTRSTYANDLIDKAARMLDELQTLNTAQAQELAVLNAAMDAVGAGGVEPLRRGADDAS